MNKPALLKAILARLDAELEIRLQAARTAAAGATDGQNKAENKYDTRGLELSYLAAGQGRQIAEARAVIGQLRTLVLRDFGSRDAIDFSAVVTLDSVKMRVDAQPLDFLAPRGGGTEVRFADRDILLVTPESPLGQQLIGRRTGDLISLGEDAAEHRIVNVC